MTLFEAGPSLGGHCHTIDWAGTPVDTGFIVYNEVTYPNLTALFRHLGVPTQASNMSFAVSLDDGRLEYSGGGLVALFAQKRNLLRPRFWAMLRDILRFFRQAPRDLGSIGPPTLDEYLDRSRLRRGVARGSPLSDGGGDLVDAGGGSRRLSRRSFIRFFNNHGLLRGDRAAELAHGRRRQPDSMSSAFCAAISGDSTSAARCRRCCGATTASP